MREGRATIGQDGDSELKDLRVRIERLATQLNRYIQLNGCSKELKDKSDRLLGTVGKQEKTNDTDGTSK